MIHLAYNNTTNTIDDMKYSNINSSNIASAKARINYLMDVVNLDNNMDTAVHTVPTNLDTVVEDNNVIRSRQRLNIKDPRYLNHKHVNLRVKFNEGVNPQIEYKYEDGIIWKKVNIKRKDANLSLSLSNGIRVKIPIKKIICAAYTNKSIQELNYKQIRFYDENKDINELYNINNLFIPNSGNLFIPNSGGYIEPENVSHHDDRYDAGSEHSPPNLDELSASEPIRGSDELSASEPENVSPHDDIYDTASEQSQLNVNEVPIYVAPKPEYEEQQEKTDNSFGLSAPEPDEHNDSEEEIDVEEYYSNNNLYYIDRATNLIYNEDGEVIGDADSFPEDS